MYAIPEFETDRIAPEDQLRRVMGEWVAEVAPSGNLVVLRTPPAARTSSPRRSTAARIDGLLGTVAGDDTLMCVAAAPTTGGDELAARLRDLAGTRPVSERTTSERRLDAVARPVRRRARPRR